MRYLLTCILILSAGTAWALSDAVIDYCLTTANPKQCLVDIQRDIAAAQGQSQWEHQAQLQRDLARQQAAGMALFGTGNALVNGMNQGMQQMQIHPYVLPPPQHIPTR